MLILKIVQTVKVIITQTNHLTYLDKVGYFNLNQNPTVQVHHKESSAGTGFSAKITRFTKKIH